MSQPMTFPEIPKSSWNIREVPSLQLDKKDLTKILVVDDEQFNCDIIEGFLMVLGMKNPGERLNACYNGE